MYCCQGGKQLLEAGNSAGPNGSEKDKCTGHDSVLSFGRKELFFPFLLHLRKKKRRVDAGICSQSTHLVEEVIQEMHPPACTSLNTARNISEWPLPLSLPSSHHPACTGGGIVLKCHRKSRGLFSALSYTLVLLLCWKCE